jgi:hypothetical protein
MRDHPALRRKQFRRQAQKPVAHFRNRSSRETTNDCKGITVDRTGQATF